jgi:hypothetical protein
MDQAVPHGSGRKLKFLVWFSSSKVKKNIFLGALRTNLTNYYNKFYFYLKLVKGTVKSDSLSWLKFVNANLNCNLKFLEICIYI